jgi:hypothetical protein
MKLPCPGPLVRTIALAGTLALAGCHGQSIATSPPDVKSDVLLSEKHTFWFNRSDGMRFQAAMLVRSLFAEVPLTAFISMDRSHRLDFVGLSDWGFPLAQASLTLDEPTPANLHPGLARMPRFASQLSLALKRVFLIWPDPKDTGPETPQGYYAASDATETSVRYVFRFSPIRLTEKHGNDVRGPWVVFLRYAAKAPPQAVPEEIVYRSDGLEIIFKLKELSGDE